jgi:hypothetical protein
MLYDKLQQSADHLSVSGQSYLSSLADAIVEFPSWSSQARASTKRADKGMSQRLSL